MLKSNHFDFLSILGDPSAGFNERKDRIAAIAGRLDWDVLTSTLDSERLIEFSGSEIIALSLQNYVPPYFWRKYRSRNLQAQVCSARAIKILATILSATSQEAIPVILMRTPYLNSRLYGGDLAARPFNDIDLAIRPDDRIAFKQVLENAFKGKVYFKGDKDCRDRKASLGSRAELTIDGVNLDIHWDLTLHYNFCRDKGLSQRQNSIWERSRVVELAWGTCRVMCDEDLLCHIAQHSVIQHDFHQRTMSQLIDFARLWSISENSLSLAKLESCIQDFGIQTAFSAMWLGVCTVFPEFARQTKKTPIGIRLDTVSRVFVSYQLACLRCKNGSRVGNLYIPAYVREMFTAWYSIIFMMSTLDNREIRSAFIRQYLFPEKDIAAYLTDKSMSLRDYQIFLVLYIPLGQILLLPAIAVLLLRQLSEVCSKEENGFAE